MASIAHDIAVSHFGRRIVSALYKQGITFIGTRAVPAYPGDAYFQATAYAVNDNGTHRLWTYGRVLEAAGAVVKLTPQESRLATLTQTV